jgi:subtilisin family serine protease
MELQQATASPHNSSNSPSDRQDKAGLLLVVLVSLWIVVVSGALHIVAWSADEFMLIMGLSWPVWVWFLIALAQGVLIGLAAIPLSRMWPSVRYRAVFKLWALCSIFVVILSPTKLIQPPSTQAANFLQIILVGIFLVILAALSRHRDLELQLRSGKPAAAQMFALIIAIIVIYPWLAWGALGSVLDTVLNLISGLLFGFAAALLLTIYLLIPLRRTSSGIGRDLILGGLATGTALLVMTSALGFNGIQILLMLFIPALCIAITGVGWYGSTGDEATNWLAVFLLIGLSVAAPMVFIDPDELVLLLAFGTKDIPYWAFSAAFISMLIAFSFSAAIVLARRHLAGAKPRGPMFAILIVSWVIGALIYVGLGQPGLHGDQFFVIMEDQAHLDGIDFSTGNEGRSELVYNHLVIHAESGQADIRRVLDTLGVTYTPYYLVNGLAISGGPVLRLWLERRSDVDRIIENPILRPLPSPEETRQGNADGPREPTWNLTLIGADRVWREFGIVGEGIVIGHADSGIQGTHPELIASYRGYNSGDDYNWYDPWYGSASPVDPSGHGTHTLGTIVGANTGVAPGAQWFGCANLARGLGNPALYLDCLQFLLAPYPPGGDPFSDGDPLRSAQVINNSWLCPEIEGCDELTLIEAVKALRRAGIFMVVATGNEGPWCGSVRFPPATFDEVFSVGAINQNGDIASFSSIGPVESDASGRIKPDLVAPGDGILSAFPQDTYEIQAGTSMAAPHVAGVVALMWSANPLLVGDIEQTEKILAETASPYLGRQHACVDGGGVPNNGSGYGVLNAYEAVKTAIALQ